MTPEGRRAVDVLGRVEIAVERARRRVERGGVHGLAAQRGLGAARGHRPRADAEEYEAHLGNGPPLEPQAPGETGKREIAVAPRQLLEAPAPALRARHPDLRDDLSGSERGRVDA